MTVECLQTIESFSGNKSGRLQPTADPAAKAPLGRSYETAF
jgi:hypothetical protein